MKIIKILLPTFDFLFVLSSLDVIAWVSSDMIINYFILYLLIVDYHLEDLNRNENNQQKQNYNTTHTRNLSSHLAFFSVLSSILPSVY
jgi:hypothetical protein